MNPSHRYRKTQAGGEEEVRDFFKRTRLGSYGKAIPVAALPGLFSLCVPRASVMNKYSMIQKLEYFNCSALAHNNSNNKIANYATYFFER